MRKNIFALLRTFMFAAFVSVLSLSIVSCGSKKGKAVDLGLSVKWATMNVGATSVTDYGKYYAGVNTQWENLSNGLEVFEPCHQAIKKAILLEPNNLEYKKMLKDLEQES